MKIVYIAHPVGGDIAGNLADLRRIIKKINTEFPDVVPLCAYYADVVSMGDGPGHRERGIVNGMALLEMLSEYSDFDRREDTSTLHEVELWLTGDHISSGMKEEHMIAQRGGILVINKIGLL